DYLWDVYVLELMCFFNLFFYYVCYFNYYFLSSYRLFYYERYFEIQRHYKVSSRRWFTLDFVELEYDGTKATFNGSREIYAPAEYSFRCQSVTSDRWPLLVPRSAKDPANQWKVSFEDFQIQGFNLSGSEFSYASDCAGFFSAGIWMGLMTSLLMVLVLTYGLHMIMQLNTMDRFDDPKGPAISVPQTEKPNMETQICQQVSPLHKKFQLPCSSGNIILHVFNPALLSL
uniref:ATPase H+ transporting accessory protein 1a n=1 Tax=Oryzias sinensis TaxID=183150 RepID=A0A8C7WT95_9TELE